MPIAKSEGLKGRPRIEGREGIKRKSKDQVGKRGKWKNESRVNVPIKEKNPQDRQKMECEVDKCYS